MTRYRGSTAEYRATLLRIRRWWTNNVIVGGETGSTGPSIPVPESGEPGLLQARRLVAESESSPCVVYAGRWNLEKRGLNYADHDCTLQKVTKVLFPQCLS